jgi:hypothetical protein
MLANRAIFAWFHSIVSRTCASLSHSAGCPARGNPGLTAPSGTPGSRPRLAQPRFHGRPHQCPVGATDVPVLPLAADAAAVVLLAGFFLFGLARRGKPDA